MEGEGMRITVVGAVLIIAAVIGAVMLIRYLARKAQQTKSQEGPTPSL